MYEYGGPRQNDTNTGKLNNSEKSLSQIEISIQLLVAAALSPVKELTVSI
jgi:hypothetical protein